jgi:AraC-like DNA-binding protein
MTTNHLPSTVDFVIPAESAHMVVTLLLSNEIAFTLISVNQAENTQKIIAAPSEIPDDPKPKADLTFDSMKPLSQTVPVFESICLKYLKQQIEQLPPKEAQIATEFGMSIGSFKNGFKAVYGKSFYQLFMEQRIEHAKTLLLKGVKAAEISQRFGYSQSIKFSKVFQKYVGMTPKTYQMSYNRNRR